MKFNLSLNNINYIKINYNDNDGFSHCTKAAIRRFSDVEIYASAKFEDGLYIKTPQVVDISVATDNGLYKAQTTLKYLVNEPPYVFFSIKSPDNMDYQQNREFFRVKIDENALISYVENEQEKLIACETYDISANGVRFILENTSNLPDIVKLTLYLQNKTIVSDAKYVRTDDEDGMHKVSFSFVDMKESDSDYISQFCLKKQMEQRRKLL